MSPSILYEDASVIVCYKPAGIPTQSSHIGTPDLVSILKNHLAQNRTPSSGKTAPPYLAVIHRLDQPVEGILVFAKTRAAAAALTRQLTSSGFGKHYRAWVSPVPALKDGILTDFLIKDARTNSSKVCPPNTPGAKKATLRYTVLHTKDSLALVEIQLETGRHHQIRVQMSHHGSPIVGDRKYGSQCIKGPLQLCAFRLQFRHPDHNRMMEFSLPDYNLSMGYVV